MVEDAVHVDQVGEAVRQARILALPQPRHDLVKAPLVRGFLDLLEFGGVNFLGQDGPTRAHKAREDERVGAIAAAHIGDDRARSDGGECDYGSNSLSKSRKEQLHGLRKSSTQSSAVGVR